MPLTQRYQSMASYWRQRAEEMRVLADQKKNQEARDPDELNAKNCEQMARNYDELALMADALRTPGLK